MAVLHATHRFSAAAVTWPRPAHHGRVARLRRAVAFHTGSVGALGLRWLAIAASLLGGALFIGLVAGVLAGLLHG